MNEVATFIATFCGLYKQHRKATYFVRRPKDLTLARLLLDTYGAEELTLMAEHLLTVQDDWIAGTDRGIGILVTKASWLANRLAQQRVAEQPKAECQHEPRCHNKSWCLLLTDREAEGWVRDSVTGKWSQRDREAS